MIVQLFVKLFYSALTQNRLLVAKMVFFELTNQQV
jgi:hypothetical protein